jgi:N6-adenosine-specific RNA methylase IME4
MKNVVCSWREMDEVRQLLAVTEKGDGTLYKIKRCFNKSNVRNWRMALAAADAAEESGCRYRHLEHFQPSHAVEIASAFRAVEKDPARWTDETKGRIADWVDRCEAERLTVQDLRAALCEVRCPLPAPERGCTLGDLQALAASGSRFGTVYADPPWPYGNQATRASTGRHYRTMAVEDIAALPVRPLTAEDAHLHLWTTNAFLFECPRILEAWGFVYKSMFVWCKPQMGIGNYWRVSHEFLVLGVRGKPTFRDRSLRSWAMLGRDKHSSKPEQVRLMIEKASPPPYLELFGRRAAQGWTVWGDEIERDLFNQGEKAS